MLVAHERAHEDGPQIQGLWWRWVRVVFDQDEKTGVDTAHIFNKKAGTTTKMKRERSVRTIEAFIDEEDRVSSFVRQG